MTGLHVDDCVRVAIARDRHQWEAPLERIPLKRRFLVEILPRHVVLLVQYDCRGFALLRPPRDPHEPGDFTNRIHIFFTKLQPPGAHTPEVSWTALRWLIHASLVVGVADRRRRICGAMNRTAPPESSS